MKIKHSSKELFSYISIFGVLSERSKLNILKVSCHNNSRFLYSPSKSQEQTLEYVQLANNLKDIELFDEVLKKVDSGVGCDNFKSNNYLEKILKANEILVGLKLDRWESSVILNVWLAQKNLCPLLFFAFDAWYNISQDKNYSATLSLIEFSTVYLYRLAPVNKQFSIQGNKLAEGSHNSLFLIEEKGQVKKIPRSIAAERFINEQEIRTTRLVSGSLLEKYIPHLIHYDKTTKIITRQFIAGRTGHELLQSNFLNENKEAIDDLKNFFNIYKKLNLEIGIALDVHPGNFVWSEDRKQWFFIDTGPIPMIGSDYFPLDSFKNYFAKIWLERNRRMKMQPIRSVDLSQQKVFHEKKRTRSE